MTPTSEAVKRNARLNGLLARRVNAEAEVECAKAELAAAQQRRKDKTLPPGRTVKVVIGPRTYQFDDLQGHVRGWREVVKHELQALRSIVTEIRKEERNVQP